MDFESYNLIFSLGRKVLDGGDISCDEALALTELEDCDAPILLGIANKIRYYFTGNQVDTCEIINARSGGCTENCKFCAQSDHYITEAPCYSLLSEDQILEAANKAEADGAFRFCIVTSGLGMNGDPDFEQIIRAIRLVGQKTLLNQCCSLGTLGDEHVEALMDAGITRYHHNLETSQNFFKEICTTHTYGERISTIKKVKAAGLQVCSGGIIGMGESWQDRIEMAFLLKELDVDSIPINILNPVQGTALENQDRLKLMDILKTFAIYRLILPDKIIRFAGGREQNLGELMPLGLLSGINGMLIGNYLTTSGRGAAKDIETLAGLGFNPCTPLEKL